MTNVNYAVLADCHVDALPPEVFNREKVLFLDHIRSCQLDVIFLAGDLFHGKIPANSPLMRTVIKFFAEVCQVCIDRDIKLRIIKGTESHDNDQLEILAALEVAIDIDIRIFSRVDVEELFPGFKVLYIPEEYMSDMTEYYKSYFEGTYDIIIGHGLVDKAAFIAHLQESEQTRPNAPIFPVARLHEVCIGPIYFGHIHTHMEVDRFRYVSSYSRYSHGEERAKGFMVGSYNTVDKDFVDIFIENTLARKYVTVKIESDSVLFNKKPQDIVYEVLSIIKETVVDFIRIKVDIPKSYEYSNLLTSMLHDSTRSRRVNLSIISSHKEKMVEELREKVDEMLEKYEIIFDKNAKVEEKISYFIKIKNDIHIPVEEIYDLMTTSTY